MHDYLGSDDTQQHRERVDRGVGYRRGVVPRHRFVVAYDLKGVAKLEAQIRHRGENQIASTHPGDGDIVEVI